MFPIIRGPFSGVPIIRSIALGIYIGVLLCIETTNRK